MSFHERLAAALAAGTSEHYEDAELYDHEYKRRRDDVRWYRALAKKELGKSSARAAILELGCGSGRTLVPLSRDGWRVVGVDASATMLDRCRARLARVRDARVELVRADFRALALGRRFPLVICPFNAFMHLYTRDDVERFLAVVRAHLAPGGLFAFDVMNPDLAWLSRDPTRRWARTRFRHPRTGKITHYSTSLSYDAALQIAFMRIYYQPAGTRRTRTIRLTHRQFFPLELEALLHYNGFSVEAHEGDFDGGALVPESEEQVLRCRSRRGFSVSRRKNI
ncbi:MAG TPA: class I SAM-dependent methyltransferase [Polyangia bacterium]|jgi:SAM-dependent methyltransferase